MESTMDFIPPPPFPIYTFVSLLYRQKKFKISTLEERNFPWDTSEISMFNR